MDWNEPIREVLEGGFRDPDTGKTAKIPVETIRIEDTLDGGAGDLVAPLKIGKRIAIVADSNSVEALGRRVAREMKGLGTIDEIVLNGKLHCDEDSIVMMQDKTRHADAIVVVGSGSLTDIVKYATFKDNRPFVSFPTSASMNGYGAFTASVTLRNGYKTSVPAHSPRGIFVDLAVNAAAPTWLPAAGLGDSMCRPVAQVEWWGSHRLFGTFYSTTPYVLLDKDEPKMIETAGGLAKHSVESNGYLYRVMMLTGFGNTFVGSSHSGSMGEHQVSHWIDMFAGRHHPGTTHGQQVGVASIALARLHKMLFELDRPPRIKPTKISETEFVTRYGLDLGSMMFKEAIKKAIDQPAADAFNEKLAEIWPELRQESLSMMMEPDEIRRVIAAAGGPISATELRLPRAVWRDAMKYGRDVRNRWSYLDLADDAGLLDEFIANDPQ
jgi:glycerol-1-phosphate dehydrogenase [NAD(P)+]